MLASTDARRKIIFKSSTVEQHTKKVFKLSTAATKAVIKIKV